ncbi:MAG TPA: hypothetical protein VMF89_07735 [Polyangiales bacterium]|nr:hypothetical protein [Polyangiales bacterium]
MRHPLRVLAVACALTLTPACASLQLGSTRIENPIAAAQSIDQRAYALLHAYAAVVEEATDIVADPATPLAFKRALGRAEHAATPAAETLQVAVTAYMRARADFNAASGANQTTIQRAATALSVAARHLNEALAAAEAPIAELEGLVRANRS